MNEENTESVNRKVSVVVACLVISVLFFTVGLPFAAYQFGRFAERRLLTEIFRETIGQDYKTGFADGKKVCEQ